MALSPDPPVNRSMLSPLHGHQVTVHSPDQGLRLEKVCSNVRRHFWNMAD